MIIKTRYRDIPFEEVKQCLTAKGIRDAIRDGRDKQWERYRGGAIEIETPPVSEKQWLMFGCDGPFYRVVGPGVLPENTGACVHIAEIGD